MSHAIPRHKLASPPPLTATFWGTRGSIATPGPATVRFGGNTACVEVRSADHDRLILDAGTGIRGLGAALTAARGPVRADIFLTHFHWDHIQGLPFFAPVQMPGSQLRIHAPAQGGRSPTELLSAQMDLEYFPVRFDALQGTIEVSATEEMIQVGRAVTVESIRVCHPSETVGYRIRSGGATLVYIPDNELHPMRLEAGRQRYEQLVAFCADADLLIHDAMYTRQEYAVREGWGHSTFEEAIALAEDSSARAICLFHHAPERTDAELDEVVHQLREDVGRRGCRLDVAAAAEGETYELWPTPQPG